MTLECPNCSARYNIEDSLIPAQGARVKCKKCSTVISIPAPVVELAPQDLELIPPPGPAPSARTSAPPTGAPAPIQSAPAPRPAPPAPVAPPPPPEEPSPFEAPSPFERGFAREPAVESQFDSGIVVDRPFDGAASIPPADADIERGGAPTRAGSQPSFAESPSAPAGETLSGLDTSMAMSGPAIAVPEERTTPAAAKEPAPRATAPIEVPESDSASPAPAGASLPAGLSADDRSKHEKARRLARVLASDIAIYNREKRDRGIREGNLVAMLGYEIKKSWEVYKERVGSEFANSTPYFRDALNEMLAEGKKIF